MVIHKTMLQSLAAVLVGVCWAAAVQAAPITVVQRSGTLAALNLNPLSGVVFTTSEAYAGVAVSALLSSAVPNAANGRGTAYLTTAVGPGTTVADEVASVRLQDVAWLPTISTPLFSGLALQAGTYYLLIASGDGGAGLGWRTAAAPANEVLDAGVSTLVDFIFPVPQPPTPAPPLAAYAPASGVLDSAAGRRRVFTISADAVAQPVPEPASAALVLLATALLLGLRKQPLRRATAAAAAAPAP